jgi:hypothetical protein
MMGPNGTIFVTTVMKPRVPQSRKFLEQLNDHYGILRPIAVIQKCY